MPLEKPSRLSGASAVSDQVSVYPGGDLVAKTARRAQHGSVL